MENDRRSISRLISDDAKKPHRPHPGLFVVVKIRIFVKERKQWSEFSTDNCHDRNVTVPVPDHVPFDLIKSFVYTRNTSEGPKKWWFEYSTQNPEDAARISRNGELDIGVGIHGLVGYVHADGTPYNIVPFKRDEVANALGESEPQRKIFLECDVTVDYIWPSKGSGFGSRSDLDLTVTVECPEISQALYRILMDEGPRVYSHFFTWKAYNTESSKNLNPYVFDSVDSLIVDIHRETGKKVDEMGRGVHGIKFVQIRSIRFVDKDGNDMSSYAKTMAYRGVALNALESTGVRSRMIIDSVTDEHSQKIWIVSDVSFSVYIPSPKSRIKDIKISGVKTECPEVSYNWYSFVFPYHTNGFYFYGSRNADGSAYWVSNKETDEIGKIIFREAHKILMGQIEKQAKHFKPYTKAGKLQSPKVTGFRIFNVSFIDDKGNDVSEKVKLMANRDKALKALSQE